MEVEVEQQHQPLKLKNIRKDVFHYLKAVMEESRIFLPMKLPEEQEILPQPTPQMPEVVHVEVPEVRKNCFWPRAANEVLKIYFILVLTYYADKLVTWKSTKYLLFYSVVFFKSFHAIDCRFQGSGKKERVVPLLQFFLLFWYKLILKNTRIISTILKLAKCTDTYTVSRYTVVFYWPLSVIEKLERHYAERVTG